MPDINTVYQLQAEHTQDTPPVAEHQATLKLSMSGPNTWQTVVYMDGYAVPASAVNVVMDYAQRYARVQLTFSASRLRGGAWDIPPDAAYVTLEGRDGRWVVANYQTQAQADLIREGRR